MNNLVKDLKILSFKVIFKCLKLVESFQKKFSVKNIWLGDQLTLMKFFKTLIFKVLCFLKVWPIFVGSVHNFGRHYLVKKLWFPLDPYVVSCQIRTKNIKWYLTQGSSNQTRRWRFRSPTLWKRNTNHDCSSWRVLAKNCWLLPFSQ